MTSVPTNIEPFSNAFAHLIWDMKYRWRDSSGAILDETIEDTWRRVAHTIAKVEEPANQALWEEQFFQAMRGFQFLPAGRILAGAGTKRRLTLFNCFVMDRIDDTLAGIFDSVKEAALTMQQGGGIGVDFSTIRPKGAAVESTGADASGPVSFMDIWDSMCSTIMSAGARRGAMMGTLRCDHPDIEAFIAAKSDPTRLRHFNLSVLVTDAFMSAVKNDTDFDLVFAGQRYRTVKARDLWHKIMQATYNYAEPGVVFIDRVNALNPLSYCENIYTTNPCGEQPLPPYGACLLGSINLTTLIQSPFEADAKLDESRLAELTRIAVRFLDNAIDVSNYPLPEQAQEARNKRRIGLGVTGLADALIMCGLRYGSPEAIEASANWLRIIKRTALLTSSELAAEKGAFPLFDADAYLATQYGQTLSTEIRDAIKKQGLRNGLLTSIAPTGTISLLAGNVSSGIEPVFDFTYKRRMLQPDGNWHEEVIKDAAINQFRTLKGNTANLPEAFVTVQDLTPNDHLIQQAALQPHIDSAISKTINCPKDISFEDFKAIYERAYDLGLKGCTTYRPNPVTGAILSTDKDTRTKTLPSRQQAASPLNRPLVDHTNHIHNKSDPHDNDSAEIVYLSKPRERAAVLEGRTYKLKWPDSEHALYITINNTVENGKPRPFEIFINTKSLDHYAWIVALTRMISAVFRRGGDVSFVVEELKAIFDPKGGIFMDGEYVPSLIAAIGKIIEQHMQATGALDQDHNEIPLAASSAPVMTSEQRNKIIAVSQNMKFCPKCAQPALVLREGCQICMACGYSKCG